MENRLIIINPNNRLYCSHRAVFKEEIRSEDIAWKKLQEKSEKKKADDEENYDNERGI